MTRTHIAALVVVAVAVPAAIAGSFSASNDAPCFVAGNTGYRMSDTASANITVRIDNAAAKPDLRVQLTDDAAAADFVLLDDGIAAGACPGGTVNPERPPRSGRRQARPDGSAVAGARCLQDLRALGRFLATGRRRLVRRDLAQCGQDHRFRTRIRRAQLIRCRRLTLLSPRLRPARGRE